MPVGCCSDWRWEESSGDNESASRKMDSIENFIWDMQGLSTINSFRNADIFACVKIESPAETTEIAERALQSWQRLRLQHPTLGTEIADDATLLYRPPKTPHLNLWSAETLVVNHTSSGTSELLASLESSPSFVLYYLTQSNEFMIHSPHVLIDGMGLVSLLSEFLHYLSSTIPKTFGNAAPSREALELPQSTAVMFKSRGIDADVETESLLDILEKSQKSIKSVGNLQIQRRETPSPAGRLEMKTLCFSNDDTNRIISCARLMNVSVTHFMHAAIAHAIQAESEGRPNSNFLAMPFIDLRDAHLSQSKARDKACALRLGLGLVHVSVGTFQETAQRLKTSYGKTTTRNSLVLTNNLVRMFGEDLQFTQEVISTCFSSFGDVSSYFKESYDGFRLCNFWSGTGPAAPFVYISAQTLFGKLDLRILYHSAFYDEFYMGVLVTRIASIVREQFPGMEDRHL